MYIETILEKANTEWEEYTFCTRDLDEHEYSELEEDFVIECEKAIIERCKNYLSVFKDAKEKFIFLFDVFLHINSVENIQVRLNGEAFSSGYEVFGFKALKENDIKVNTMFFKWLNKELLCFDFKDLIYEGQAFLPYHHFHDILENAFNDLVEMNNFIYDTTKPQKELYLFRLEKTVYVYDFQIHNENELYLFFRSKLEKYEETTLKIAYLVSVIEYLSMYNQYTKDGGERPMYRSANHKTLTKIHNYLIKTLEKTDLVQVRGRGRPSINKQENDYRLNWKGSHLQLADLIYELNKKGWIEQIEDKKDVAESIMGLFKVKDSENVSSFQQNMKQSIHNLREQNRDDNTKNYFSEIEMFKKQKKIK